MSKSLAVKSTFLLGTAFAALAGATTASAQDAPAASATPAVQSAPESADLGDIVVTAERRSENLQKVPVSVGVIGGDDLRAFQSGGSDILDLANRVPGLYAETTTGRIFPRFYIRGLGNIDFYLGASQPVSIIQDDVVLEHVVLKSNPVFDVKQVEVLRGPQGTLFGRNTTAGIIKFDTNRPTNDFEGRMSASYGTYNTATIDAGVGGPIVKDVLSFRVSGLFQHRDNWITNTFTGTSDDGTVGGKDKLGGFDEKDVRVQLMLTPPDTGFTGILSAHARDYSGTSTIFHRGAVKLGSNDVSAEPRASIGLDEAINNPQAYKTYGTSLNLKNDFGGVVLTSISAYETSSGYSRGDTDGGVAANFTGGRFFGESQGRLRDLDQLSQEVRLSDDGTGRFKWQIGGIYFDSRDTTEFDQRGFFLTSNAFGTTPNPNNYVVLRNVNTSYAGFGQVSYEILPNLTLTGGVRETYDEKTTRLVTPPRNAAGVPTFPATAATYVRLADTQPSWEGSLNYAVDPNVNVFARVSHGFRGPTIQGRNAVFGSAFVTATSETITSYEAGFKSNLFANTLRFNATGFYYKVKNIQLNGNDANNNGLLFNANQAQAWGGEAELTWRPVRDFTLGLGGSVLHTEVNDTRVYTPACFLNGATTCTVLNPTITIRNATTGAPTAVLAQINGNVLPNAPKYQLDANARYDYPLGNGGKLFVGGDYTLQGYTSFVPYKTVEYTSDGTFELGLKAGYTAAEGKYEIAVFTRNVTNEKNLKGVLDNYNAAVFNDPRIIGVSLSGKF